MYDTKNKEPRAVPFTAFDKLHEIMLEARDRANGSDYVFPGETGNKIHSHYGAWNAAVERAGHPDLLLHDMRRSAVRNMERAGVARSVAMSITGHKTESIYRRYAIVDSVAQREGLAKLATLTTGGAE